MFARLFALFSRGRLEREFESEIEDHLALLRERYFRQGMTPAEADLAARRQFGGIVQIKETHRDHTGFPRLENLLQDVLYGMRALRRSPGFTTVAVLSLALGIGANTAIYSVMNAVLLRALPVAAPERLVVAAIPFVKRGELSYNQSFSYPQYRQLRDHGKLLDSVICFRTHSFSVSTSGSTELATGVLVSGNYFSTLGVRPTLGTAIDPSDDVKPGSGGARGPVVVLSYRFWVRRFGSNPAAVGQSIDVNGYPFTIAGVAPEGFTGTEVGETADVFAPMMMQSVLAPENRNALEQPRNVWLRIMGRLKPDSDPRQAEAELTLIYQQFRQGDNGASGLTDARKRAIREMRIALLPGATGISGLRKQYGTLLVILMVVVGVVLLIACANVANLALARAAGRQRELAVRLALGATRQRLLALLLTESLLLSGAGTMLGLLLSRWARDLVVRALIPTESLDVSLDAHVLAVTIAVGLAAGVLFGLAPALQSGRAMLGRPTGLPMRRLARTLVSAQVALSVILLIGAGLFLRTLVNLRSVDPGFTRQNILLASTNPNLNGYAPERGKQFYANLLDAVRGIPGVRSASLADSNPLNNHTFWDFYLDAQPLSTQVTSIAPEYFATMNIRILLGRDISGQDLDAAPKVAVVNEAFARQYFPNESAVGKRFGLNRNQSDIEIVGVVQDSKYQGLREPAPGPMLYVSYRQFRLFDAMIVHARTAGNPAPVVAALREQVHRLDPNLPVYNIHTVEEQIDSSLAGENLMATVALLFALLALTLSAAGVYGVMAYAVSRRTREVGIRVALGAGYGSIVQLILRDAAVLIGGGILAGVPVAYALARLAVSRFFGVTPGDAPSIALAAVILSVAGLLAAWIPARRAARVDPMVALRTE
uniref:Permease n=1 Tax=Solibacter usitatus (strain Ellin6076) TaxID=234267 RepID=Q02B05_SOLUE